MTITVAYDGSQVATEAVGLARRHAEAFNTEIEVIQAVENGAHLEYPAVEKLEKKFAQEVDQLLGAQDIPYKAVLLVGAGSAGDQIVRRLDRTKSQAICLGIMRRSKMGKLLFGSTAQYVILNAPCPVISIR